MGSSTGRRATFTPKTNSSCEYNLLRLIGGHRRNPRQRVRLRRRGLLLDVLERFNPKNINAALREYFEDGNGRVTEFLGCVDYFEEERTLLDLLEKFDVHNVNAALREYFGLQTRDKLPDFVDAEKL